MYCVGGCIASCFVSCWRQSNIVRSSMTNSTGLETGQLVFGGRLVVCSKHLRGWQGCRWLTSTIGCRRSSRQAAVGTIRILICLATPCGRIRPQQPPEPLRGGRQAPQAGLARCVVVKGAAAVRGRAGDTHTQRSCELAVTTAQRPAMQNNRLKLAQRYTRTHRDQSKGTVSHFW